MSGLSVAAIERELANVWREEAAGEEADRAVTRARVATLLVYDDASAPRTTLDETLFAVTEQHPARALVMRVDRGAADASVSAAVVASCRVQGPRSKQLSCEQVNFDATGKGAEELPSAVAQLLAEDVPVFLWWRAVADLDDYVFNRLVRMSDRVILDSSISTSPREDLMRLAKTLRDEPSWIAATDFTWQRLTPWREMFASFYDSAEYRPYLDRVDRLTIQYGTNSATEDISPRAVLLASWFAERLDWKLDADASSHDGDDNKFVFRAGDREIVTRFTAVQRPGLEGLLSSVRLETTTAPAATFSVTRAERSQLASEAVLDGRVHASRVLSYRSRNEAELLATELGIVGRDRLYEKAVAIAGAIGAIREE